MYPKLFGVIDSYTVMLVLGVIAAAVVFELYMRKFLKVSGAKVFYLEISLIVAIAAGILGAYLFQNLYNFIEDPAHYTWSWQLTFYGGLIMGVGVFFLMYGFWGRKHYPEGLRQVLSIAPGAITLAHAFGRIGCFLEGCCYGIPTDAWYGIQFVTTTEKVVPTNLFEAIFLFLLSAALILLAVKRRCEYAFGFYFILYGIWRFFIEFLRGDHRGGFIPGISPSQFWSLLLIVLGIAYIIFFYNLRKRERQKACSVE